MANQVLRGGSWHDWTRGLRAAYRYLYDPRYRIELIGFRCIYVPIEPDPNYPRVRRGGAWFSNARHVRAAYRDAFLPGSVSNGRGFRCISV